jgi:membrane protein DedA with SNARE-associated domain
VFDWITGFIEQSGYLGLFLLMFVENIFPPIPSELIMPLGGFTAARGDLHIALVIIAGTLGSLAGALFWYYVGRWVGAARLKRWAARHGRWLTLAPNEVDQANAWFDRHCGKAVFFGRLLPTVRTLISIPAGIAEMSLPRFLLFSTLGTAIWTGLLAGAGYLLEAEYRKVAEYLNPVSDAVVAILVLGYLYRVATFRRRVADRPGE